MHNDLSKDGLQAVSVALDPLTDDEGKDVAQQVKDDILTKLRKWKAAFPNLLLDEKPEVWQEKFDITGPPCVYVFNRQGKIAEKFAPSVKYDEVRKLAEKLLKE